MAYLLANIKTWWCKLQTQLCTLAICLSLTNSLRLPGLATGLGSGAVAVAVTACSLVVALPVTLLQLAAGQLSQQDVVGVWRAVPVLRGIGYIRLITSFACCVYNMIYTTLAAVYFIWAAKGPIPFRECTKLQITENGYANKVNASECFNKTFLAPLSESPQYFGFMAIIVFVLWFFTPLMLYGLKKSMKIALVVLTLMTLALAMALLAQSVKIPAFESEPWSQLGTPVLWHAALVQAMLSTQITGGYLVAAGGSIYAKSDVRWNALSITATNIIVSWVWILFWQSVEGIGSKDNSLISVLVTIYQATMNYKYGKWFPLLGYGLIFVSGLISTLIYLYPVYEKLRRSAGQHWQVAAAASSALGTALTLALLAHGLQPVIYLDRILMPALAVFPTVLEIIGFVLIYGSKKLLADINFLTGTRVTRAWIVGWWTALLMLVGLGGWWTQYFFVSHPPPILFWSLIAVLICMLVIIIFAAIIAVIKEEQYNIYLKLKAAFRPSRLWGPEEPMARYHWMSRRQPGGYHPGLDYDDSIESDIYPHICSNGKVENNNGYLKEEPKTKQRVNFNSSPSNMYSESPLPTNEITTYLEPYTRRFDTKIPKFTNQGSLKNSRFIKEDDNSKECGCKRHFSINFSYVRNGELTTNL